MIKNITDIFIWHVLLMMIISSCSEKMDVETEIIARAGGRTLDWTILNRSYHLEPKWGKGLTYKQAYINQLNYLVDQKLFAQAAISSDLHKGTDNEIYLDFIKEKEMIKELYRQEVESRIEITEEEYKSAYKKLKTEIRLAYISTPDIDSAEKYLSILHNKSVDDLILFNPESEEKGVTPFFTFGEMAEEIDDVAFDLALNETAGPIKVDKRFMVIKLLDGSREKIFSDADLNDNKSKIKQIIFERKASGLSNQYINQLLKDEDVKLNPDIFFILAEHFNAIVQREDGAEPIPVNLTDLEIKKVQIKIEDIKDDVLVTYRRGQMTVEKFVSNLSSMPSGIRPMVKMSQNLKLAIGIIVRNEYLVEKAYEENLDTDKKVLFETQWQTDQLLSRKWLSRLRAQISLSPHEIDSFLISEDYLEIRRRSDGDLTSEQVENLLVDFKFLEAKMKAADSLRGMFDVYVDSTRFLSNIKTPNQIINENPIKLIYREKFN